MIPPLIDCLRCHIPYTPLDRLIFTIFYYDLYNIATIERRYYEPTKSGSGSTLALLIAWAPGIASGAIVTWAVLSARPAQVHIVEGHVASVNVDGTAFSLVDSTEGYRIGSYWRIGTGPWNDTLPTCLEPLSGSQKVRLGIVDVALTGNAFGRTVVVWVECLE